MISNGLVNVKHGNVKHGMLSTECSARECSAHGIISTMIVQHQEKSIYVKLLKT
jgi:hypothetical protein